MIRTELRKSYVSPMAEVLQVKCLNLLQQESLTDGSLQADGEDMPAQP